MVQEVSLLLVINMLAFAQGGGYSPEWTDPSSDALDIYICESFQAGGLVMNLYATDMDMNILIYSIDPSSVNATELFVIEESALKIKAGVTADDLDFEGDTPLRSVDIRLVVTDQFYSAAVDCIIYIEDTNDNAPVFGQREYMIEIPDTSSNGSFVQNVTATDADGTEENNLVTYSLGGAQSAKFSIDQNGLINLTDTVAAGDVYAFTVIATDSNPDYPMSSEVNISVNVVGEVGAAPVFLFPNPEGEDECKIFICETAAANDTVITFAATDEDTDVETLTYNIDLSELSVRSIFEIDGKNLKVQNSDLLAEGYFDYEANQTTLEYPIIVEVFDGTFSTQLSTKVCVEDVNDNSPRFLGPFTFPIPESTTGGTPVFTVMVEDDDGTAPNNQVSIELQMAPDEFELDPLTNVVSVKPNTTFNFDVASEYIIYVLATDNATENQMAMEQIYSIRIVVAPELVSPDPEDEDDCKIYICEFAAANDTIITFAATDKDTDVETLTYNIDPSNEDVKMIFIVNGENLTVKSDVPDDFFDYEAGSARLEYNITVEVSDGSLSTQLSTKVCVEDVNDNSPRFLGPFTTSIPQSTPEGTPVLTVSVTDDDGTAPNNVVTIELQMESDKFELDPQTKNISVKTGATFDSELQSEYIVSVLATDNAEENQMAMEQNYTITIEAAPKLVYPDPESDDECKIYICESAQANDIVLTFAATDKDTDIETLTYSIDQSNEDVKMILIVNGNNLTVKSDVPDDFFDYEAGSARLKYNITVEVSDGRLTTQLSTKVCVEDMNDKPPRFLGPFTAPVIESATEGTPVLEVMVADDDGTAPNNQTELQMTSDKFELDPHTNVISVKAGATFDYDLKPQYTVNVTATDNAVENPLSTEQMYTITIETAPVFLYPDPDNDDECQLYICELTQNGETFAILAAADRTPPAGDFIYDMGYSGHRVKELFQIVGNELIVNSSNVDFDYEKPDQDLQYTFVFTVSDGNYSSMMTATLCIEDENDNAPVFENTDNEGFILESASPGTFVLNVTANDSDGTLENNQVTYNLSGPGSENFDIDEVGSITVASGASLNFTTTPEYMLTVTASDNVPEDEKTAAYDINISILTAPVFLNPDPDNTDECQLYICELTQNGETFAILAAADSTPPAGDFIYDMGYSGHRVKELFQIVGNELMVNSSDADFDYEKPGQELKYTFVFTVSDGNYSSMMTATLCVEDKNDHAPEFENTGNKGFISESASSVLSPAVIFNKGRSPRELKNTSVILATPGDTLRRIKHLYSSISTEKCVIHVVWKTISGTFVLKVTANDGDGTPEYNQVTYSLSGTGSENFEIDEFGNITLASGASLNYTATPEYMLNVTASDNVPDDEKIGAYDINICVLTEPIFENLQTQQRVTIDENPGENDELYQLVVTDEDNVGELSVEIKNGSNPEYFMVDESYRVKVARGVILDAEESTGPYTLTFKATDGTSNVTSAELIITIRDTNDNKPMFTDMNPTVEIAETAEQGFVVTTVNATDADIGNQDNNILYLLSGDDFSDFSINITSGEVTVAGPLDFTRKSVYNLTVWAADSDVNPQTETTNLTIILKTGPKFTAPLDGDTLTKQEKDTSNGTVITELTASDEDGDMSFSYEVVSQDPSTPSLFGVNGSNLVMLAAVDVDAEGAVANYTVQLKVSDGTEFTEDQTMGVVVYIQDSNEAPIFDPATVTTNLKEWETAGNTVYTAQARDNDKNITFGQPSLTYSMRGTTDLIINPQTGEVKIGNGVILDHNVTDTYTVIVTAEDGLGLTSSLEITFDVVTGAVFDDPLNNAILTIAEKDTGNNALVKALTASDKDGDQDITFEITKQIPATEPPLFAINSTNQLVMTKAVNADLPNTVLSYIIELKASDGIDYTRDNSINVTVQIEDSNEYQTFNETEYIRNVTESSKPGTVVLTVTATDTDTTPAFNTMQYVLSSETDDKDYFTVNETTGAISVARELDYDNKKSYEFYLVAFDISDNPLLQKVPIKLNVITGAVFTDPVDKAELIIAENDTGINALVKVLTTLDKDSDGDISIELLGQTPTTIPAMFDISNNQFVITKAVDADAPNAVLSYNVTLKVSDGRIYTDDNIIIVTVMIEDSNENPAFLGDPVPINLLEGETEGNTVYNIQATDNDITESFGQPSLKYSITGTPHLAIDPDTGDIKIASGAVIDYNSEQSYTVIVTATDGGGLTNSTERFFQIVTGAVFINPVNNTELTIAETKTGIDAVKVLTTLDKDNDGNITIEILQQSPSTSPAMFAISNTDQLVMTEAVDADEPNAVLLYSLQIKVSDGRAYTPDSMIFVTVKIEDINEPPTFEKQEYSSEVKVSSKLGTFVLTVTATDEDIKPEYSVLHYALSSANDDKDYFIVNETTGDISVAKDLLDYNIKPSYEFNVVASDGSAEPESKSVVVKLKVLTAPQFDNLQDAMTVEVIENSAGNTFVFELQINDKDQQVAGTTINTTIHSQTPGDMFKLDGTTLRTKTAGLDAETQQNYAIIFKAKAGSDETLSGELMVKILDANDEPPVIVPVGDITIAENKPTTGPDSEIVTIMADDKDVTEPNSKLTFSIDGGNDDGLFAIDSSTGLLTLVNRPVSMTKNEHTLSIKVVDGGSPQNEATTDVKIIINEKTVEECTDTLCQNGATCMSFVNAYFCQCVFGFNETHCTNNINDCTPDRCKNGGQCRDGVNSFMCDCPEGWTGGICTEACYNHRYGPNCESQCLCNTNGLRNNFGDQMCHIQNGDCFCNDRYSGKTCENDVNECTENLDNCISQANTICNNTIGGFSCLCRQGYEENNNGICTLRPLVPPIFAVGEFPVPFVITTGINGKCPDLTNPFVFEVVKANFIKMILAEINNVMTNVPRVVVYNISCGSLVYNFTVVTQDTDEDKAALANAIQAIADAGTVAIGGENVTVNSIIVENKEVQPSSQTSGNMEERVCSVYTSFSPCASGEECKYENGVPSCKNIAGDNLALILGLGLGLLVPLLLVAILFAIVWNIKKRRELSKRRIRKWEYIESSSGGNRFPTRYYDNNGFSSGSLYSIKGYYGMPEVEVVKYGRQRY